MIKEIAVDYEGKTDVKFRVWDGQNFIMGRRFKKKTEKTHGELLLCLKLRGLHLLA